MKARWRFWCSSISDYVRREVLGLTVGGVDGVNVFVNGTKNQNAKRRLELYAPVAKLLAKHCAKRPLSERIFASDRATKPAPNWMYKRLHAYCDEAKIGRVCPHSLRGLHSSLALEAGATSNDVARSLGHSSFAITAKHYAKADSIEVGKARRMAGRSTGRRGDIWLSAQALSVVTEIGGESFLDNLL